MRIIITFFSLLLLILQSCENGSYQAQFQANYQNYLDTISQQEREKLQPLSSLAKLELETLTGRKITVGKQSNKPSIVILFSIGCPACEAAVPELAKAAEGWENKVNVLGIGSTHTAGELKSWQQTSGIQLSLVADPASSIYGKFANRYVPRIYVINTDGKVLYQDYGWKKSIVSNIELALGL